MSASGMYQALQDYRVELAKELGGSPFADDELEPLAEYIERTLGCEDTFDPPGLEDVDGMTGREIAGLNDCAHDWARHLFDLAHTKGEIYPTGSAAMRWFLRFEGESLLRSIDLLNQCAVELLTGRRGVRASLEDPDYWLAQVVGCPPPISKIADAS